MITVWRLNTPFPAALDDAVATYRWLLGTGILPENIVFIGDSAGGGLSLAALLALRDLKEKLPAGAALITPWTDLLGTGESRKAKQESDLWYNPDSIEQKAGELYAGVIVFLSSHPLPVAGVMMKTIYIYQTDLLDP